MNDTKHRKRRDDDNGGNARSLPLIALAGKLFAGPVSVERIVAFASLSFIPMAFGRARGAGSATAGVAAYAGVGVLSLALVTVVWLIRNRLPTLPIAAAPALGRRWFVRHAPARGEDGAGRAASPKEG